ncbi:HECT domain-containing protein [Histoplasma ohiense]|nr:HECT domain-containing protein [Histoplasma ohiense (nom. inval.)]
MTRLRGGSGSAPDPGRPTAVGDRGLHHPSKLPAGFPDVLTKNTIAVTDPARVLPWNKEKRQRDFNILVKRYKSQLLYGCQDPFCTAPTCFSYRKRASDVPLRRFTELSARTVACYLASQDNPERGLCRNIPAINTDFLSGDPTRQHRRRSYEASQQNVRFASDFQCSDNVEDNGTPKKPTAEKMHQTESGDNGTVSKLGDENEKTDSPQSEGAKGPLRLKDPKSFTQNLFDTLSLRMVEWLPLRKSPEAFDTTQSDPNEDGNLPSKSPEKEAPPRIQDHPNNPKRNGRQKQTASQPSIKPRRQSIASSNPQPTAVEVKIPGQPVKRLSLGEMEHRKQPSKSFTEDRIRSERKPARKVSSQNTPSNQPSRALQSPPPLKHRPQRHSNANGDVSNPSKHEQRQHMRVSRDGSRGPRKLENSERDNNRVSIDYSMQHSQSATHPPEIPVCKNTHTGKQLKTQQIQTLSHLSKQLVTGLEKLMFENDENRNKWDEEMSELESRGYSEPWDWQYATPRQREVFPFVAQSVFYVLSSPRQLLQSFRKDPPTPSEVNNWENVSTLDIDQVEDSFRILHRICPWETTLHSLWISLEKLFVPPKEFSLPRPRMLPVRWSTSSGAISKRGLPSPCNTDSPEEYISDADAAYIAVIVLLALATSIPLTDPRTWEVVRHVRSSGTVLPDAEMRKHSGSTRRSLVAISEKFEHDLALRLLNRLVRAVSARLAFHEISKTRTTNIHDIERQEKHDFTSLILQSLRDLSKPNEKSSHIPPPFLHEERPTNLHMITVEWLRSLLLKEWDGKPEMAKSGAAGGALQLLESMYTDRSKLGLRPEDFHTAFLSERLDPTEMPVEWLGILQNNKSVHLLSYPFLFPPSALVIYFRAINYSNMSKSYEAAMTTSRHVTQPAFSSIIPIDDDVSLLARLKTSISTYLVLVVRRDNVLTDALDQLWRRERRELMRPLKVQMGMDEGEEGIDHGGVQQEFFRVAFGEALDPSYGMFTMDMRTRISWFQPCSMEPLYKFELLGLLTSLAVYNGLTLPVNFPVALYKKLLGLKVKTLDDIQVGWPELAKGLSDLLSWDDGDVGDIFMRTYEFSFEAFGNFVSVDMEKVDRTEPWPATERPTWERKKRGSYSRQSWSGKNSPRVALDDNVSMLCECADENSTLKRDGTLSGILKGASSRTYKATPPSPPQEAALVTNANRERFVKDYIFWLTDKSIRPQYEAFARGFYTCLDRTALSIFTPEALKTVIEGIQEINIEELEHHTRYEGGFEPGHRVIRDFWVIVKGYSQTRKRQLLEFVTASDRVPVNGISSIMFVIQRNGTGDSRLPTSLTCFGRLLLPDYSSRDILEEKLEKALENARGFGVA